MLSDGSIDQMNYWTQKNPFKQFIAKVKLKNICVIYPTCGHLSLRKRVALAKTSCHMVGFCSF